MHDWLSNALRVFIGMTLVLSLNGWSEDPFTPDRDSELNPWTHLNFRNNPDNFQFVVVTDRNGGVRYGVFDRIPEKINSMQPEFVMSVGDFIEGYTDDEKVVALDWEEFNAIVSKLEMPFFYVTGNHDVTNPMQVEKWKERYGRTYYHFIYKNVLFLAIDSQDPPGANISVEQQDYFKKVIADHPEVRWTLLFLHQPMWLHPPEKGFPAIEEALQGRPYTVYAGHVHNYMKYQRHGRDYYTFATTGGSSQLRGEDVGEFDHIVWVTFTDEGPRVANLMFDGIQPDDIRTESSAGLIASIMNRGVSLKPLTVQDVNLKETETELVLTNEAEIPMMVSGWFSDRSDLRVSPNSIVREIPAKSSEKIKVRFEPLGKVNVADIEPVVLNWEMKYEPADSRPVVKNGQYRMVVEGLSRPCPKRQTPVAIDGFLDEWSDLPVPCRVPGAMRLNEETWRGPDDCSFRFATAYDDAFLYIAIETVDDVLAARQNVSSMTQRDSAWIWLDARDEATRKEKGSKESLSFGIEPGQTIDIPVNDTTNKKYPPGTKAVCVRTTRGHNTEIAIPVSYLNARQGKSWENFRLNIGVADFDAPTGPGVGIAWRPDWNSPVDQPTLGVFNR